MVGVEDRAVNKKQTIVLWVGVIIIAGMLIYPPWHFSSSHYKPLRCDWLWGPPSAYLDKTRLFIQIAIVIMVCGALILTLKERKTKGESGGFLSTMGISNDKAKKRIKAILVTIGRTIIVIIIISGLSFFFYIICGAIASINWHKLTQREHTSRFAESDTVGNVATPSVPKKSSFSHLDTQPITDKPEPVRLDPAAAHTFEDWDEDTEPVYIDPCALKRFEDYRGD